MNQKTESELKLVSLAVTQFKFSVIDAAGKVASEVMRFLATFSGSVAREGEFTGDEVEHGGHVFHRPVPANLTLHG
jgi:hypothetical protein